MNFNGKVAILTGGTSGIGFAIAKMLSRNGATIILTGRDEEKGKIAESQVKNAVFVKTDVTSEASILKLIEIVIRKYKSVDIVINNAGIDFSHQDITKLTEDQYNLLMDTDFKSVVFMTKHTIPHLITSKGTIVNIASQLAFEVDLETPVYCSAKAAVVMFTKTQALAYSQQGVRINCVCPGAVNTPLLKEFFKDEQEMNEWYKDPKHVPLQRIGTPEEVANIVYFLASDQASYVTGVSWLVDGGSSLI